MNLHLLMSGIACFKTHIEDEYTLIVKVALNEDLKKIQGDIEKSLYHDGIIKKRSKYSPHITIMRRSKMAVNIKCAYQFKVDSMCLMETTFENGRLLYKKI